MKKVLLVFFCLLLSLFLLPGGMASWGDTLSIGGSVTVVHDEEDQETGDEELEPLADLFTDEEDQEDEASESRQEAEPEPKPEPISYELIISTTGNGTTSPEKGEYTYIEGDEIELEAVPTDGWRFDKWIVNEDETFSASTIKITIYENVNIEAVFVEIADSGGNDNKDAVDSNEDKDRADNENGSGGEEKVDEEVSDVKNQESDPVKEENSIKDKESDNENGS